MKKGISLLLCLVAICLSSPAWAEEEEVVPGYAYSLLDWVPMVSESWSLPVDVKRGICNPSQWKIVLIVVIWLKRT